MEIDDELKNRIAGVFIVTILAVIFLPMFFDDSETEKVQEVSELKIPQKHEVSPSLTATILPETQEDTLIQPNPGDVSSFSEDTDILYESPNLVTSEAPVETAPDNMTEQPQLKAPASEVVKTPKTLSPPPVATQPQVFTTQPEITKPIAPPEVVKPLEPPQLKLPSKQQATRWFIQVASFSAEKNANTLRDKLRTQGFSAHVDSSWTKKGRLYRVKVGPELDRQRAEIIKTRVNQLNNVKSIIRAE